MQGEGMVRAGDQFHAGIVVDDLDATLGSLELVTTALRDLMAGLWG